MAETNTFTRAFARRTLLLLLLSIAALLMPSAAYAVTCTSAASGSWDAAATWNCGAGVANGPPLATDKAFIQSAHTVDLDTDPTTIAGLRVDGVLDLDTFDIRVNGEFEVNGAGPGIIDGGTVELAGASPDNTIAGTGTIDASVLISVLEPYTVLPIADLTILGDVRLEVVFGPVTVTNNGIITIGGDLIGGDSSSTWVQGSNSELHIDGVLLAFGILQATNIPNLVDYTGSGQTVKTTTYHDLQLSGDTTTVPALTVNHDLIVDGTGMLVGGVNVLNDVLITAGSDMDATATMTIGRDLVVGATGHFDGSTFSHSIGRDALISGTALFDSVSIANNLIVNSGGTVTATDAITVGNDLIVNTGGTFNGGSFSHSIGRHFTVHGDANDIAGTIGGNLTVNGTADATGVLTITGNLVVGSGGIFTGGAFAHDINGSALITGTAHFGAVDIAVDLVINSGGVVNANASLTIGNDLIVNTGGTFNGGSFSHSIGRHFTVHGDANDIAGTIGGNLTVNGTADATGILTITGNLVVGSGGIFTGGAFAHDINGSALITGLATFDGSVDIAIDLVINSGGEVDANAALTIGNDIIVNAGGTFTGDGSSHSIGNDFVIHGDATLIAGIVGQDLLITGDATAGGPLTVLRDLIVDGGGLGATFDAGPYSHIVKRHLRMLAEGVITSTGMFTLNGTVVQQIEAQAGPISEFEDLTLNNFNGFTVLDPANFIINGTLDLVSGVVTMQTQPLVIDTTGDATRTSGFVIGIVQHNFGAAPDVRLFPIGTPTGEYTPVTVDLNSATVSGSLQAKVIDAIHPQAALTFVPMFTRYWILTPTGFTSPVADLSFTYVAEDVAGSPPFAVWKWDGVEWSIEGPVDTGTMTGTVENATEFSDWTIGGEVAPCMVVNPNDSGEGSLRQAIIDANAGDCGATPVISFFGSGIGTHNILTALPAITHDDVTINGFANGGGVPNTAPFGSAMNSSWGVILNGPGSLLGGFDGLTVDASADRAIIQGLRLQGFASAIVLKGADGKVLGNQIGDPAATNPNGIGVKITGAAATGNLVGGSDSGRNMISGSHGAVVGFGFGVKIEAGADDNTVSQNYIGTATNGTAALANAVAGVLITGASDGNVIDLNLISGNSQSGILLEASSNIITNNRIGTNGAGTAALPNGVAGIALDSSGGMNLIDGNVVSGHAPGLTEGYGIYVNTSDNTISNNKIGTNLAGSGGIANDWGIYIDGDGDDNLITLNRIAFNAIDGVGVFDGVGNLILTNVMHDNAGIGIDLDSDTTPSPGRTPNDAGDADTGTGNNFQNFPVIVDATLNGTTLDIHVTVDSSAVGSTLGLKVEVFKASASEEGMTSLGTFCFSGNSLTNQLISIPSAPVTGSDFLTATVTSYTNSGCTTGNDGTSEFADIIKVNLPPVANPDSATTYATVPVAINVLDNDTDPDGGTLTIIANTQGANGTVTCSTGICVYTSTGSFYGTDTFTYTISDGQGGTDVGTVTVTVLPMADLSVTKTGPFNAEAGGSVTYTIVITNDGPTEATDVTVSDPDSAFLTWVSNSGGCTGGFPCSLGTLAPGASLTITSTFSISPSATNEVTNGVSLASPVHDPDLSNNSATAATSLTACPPSITGRSPVAGSSNVPTAGTLSWSSNGSDSYQVFLSLAGTGCTTSLGTTSGTSIAYSGLEASTAYEWKIVGKKAGCPDVTTNCIQFTTGCASDITGRVPANNATGVPTSGTLSWNANGSSFYRVYLGPVGSGCTTPLGIVAGTSIPYSGLQLGTTYEWKIEGIRSGCPTVTTTCIRFTTGCPSGFTGMLPAANATGIPTSGFLTWNGNGSTSYKVYLGVSGSGCSTLLGEVGGTSIAYTGLQPGVLYEWKIEGIRSGCPTVTSSCLKFTTAQAICSDDAPVLISPSMDATVFSPVSFSWTAILGATQYRVFLDGGSSPVATTASTSTMLSVAEGAHTWVVEAVFDFCPTVRSATGSFTVSGSPSDCDNPAPSLSSPANGASLSSPVSFSWSDVGATGYRVWASVDGRAPVVVASTSGATTAQASLPSGIIDWYVEALFDLCPPTISSTRRINVPVGAGCSSAAPQLTAPASGASASSPVPFSWSAVSGAVRYSIWISVNGGTASIHATTSSTSATLNLPPGVIDWFVEATVPNCPITRSSTRRLTVTAPATCQNSAPGLIAPADGASNLQSLVVFQWTDVGASEYRVWARSNGSLPEMIGTTLAATSLTAYVEGSTVEWWVEALLTGCPTRASAHRTFSIAPVGTCNNNGRTTLLSPGEGVKLNFQSVLFQWSSVANAIGYRLWAIHNGGTPTELALLASPQTSFEAVLPQGTIDWYVETLFTGCSATRSTTTRRLMIERDAFCDRRPPLLVSPPHGAARITSPVQFVWTAVPGASGYRLKISVNGSAATQVGGTITGTSVTVPVPGGYVEWWIEALISNCPPLYSSRSNFRVIPVSGCDVPETPLASVIGNVKSGKTYLVLWVPVPGASLYEIQESTDSFAGAPVRVVNGVFAAFTHTAGSNAIRYGYRVRAISDCAQERGPFSEVVYVRVGGSAETEAGDTGSIQESVQLCLDAQNQVVLCSSLDTAGSGLGSLSHRSVTVNLTTSEPWMSVSPSTTAITPEGTTVTVTSDTSVLPTGTSTASLIANPSSGGSGGGEGSVAVSVSMLSPVSPKGKTEPLPHSMIVPAVAHTDGQNSEWVSNIRVVNTTALPIRYRIHFTPSYQDGTKGGKETTIEVRPGATLALDDVLANWFGGEFNDGMLGVLEIRPLDQPVNSFGSFATSRTFNVMPQGTFGMFIPAIRFSEFVGKAAVGGPPTNLSLQQIAQSSEFRTNVGVVEAAGKSVSLRIKVFNASGSQVGEIPVSLMPGEHRQFTKLLEQHGISLAEGRLEVEVVSGEGRVTAYAAVVDNVTQDPQLVQAVQLSKVLAEQYILSGVADFSTAFTNWRTDVRLFNPSGSPVSTTVTFYPQNSPESAITKTVLINAGEVKIIDNVLRSFFGITDTGGALHIRTSPAAPIVATARTYDQLVQGTMGQFIPARTPDDAVGVGERALQILQVEQSAAFRANLGITEVTGNPVTVRVTAILPGAQASLSRTVNLRGFEFTQLISILQQMGLEDVYNVRLTVQAVDGTGKIVAYTSVVDNVTDDPTYIPAQ